jgi:hypothetical protein
VPAQQRRTEGPGNIATAPPGGQENQAVVMEQVGTTQPGVPDQVVMIEDPAEQVALIEPTVPVEVAPTTVPDAGIEPIEPGQIEVPGEAEAETETQAPGLGPNPWLTRSRVTVLVNANRQIARGRTLSRTMEKNVIRWARNNRGDPRPHLLIAANYYLRHVESGALDRYDLAQRVASDARNDPRMLRHMVRLAAAGSVASRAATAVVHIYGALAREQVTAELARTGTYDAAAIARLQALQRRLR